MIRLWRAVEWVVIMGVVCWLFIRMWTDTPFSRRRRSGLLDRLRGRLSKMDAPGKALPSASKWPTT